MILFLPPAPHTGAFFDTVRRHLSGYATEAATYPGYGGVPATAPTIEAYAASLLPQPLGTALVGFHTGCLVALEMALRAPSLGRIVLVDVPLFTAAQRADYASGLDPDDPAQDAFRAAFAYDLDRALATLDHPATLVATDSSLFEPTRRAASIIRDCELVEARHIGKPAFEGEAMAELLRGVLSDISQTSPLGAA